MTRTRSYIKNIIEQSFDAFKFVVYYLEVLNGTIPEFPHHHHPYQIYYPLEGEIVINVNGRDETVRAHEAIFLDHGAEHQVYYTPEKHKKYFAVIFDLVPNRAKTTGKGPDGPFEFEDICNVIERNVRDGCCIRRVGRKAEETVEHLMNELDQRGIGWNTMLMNDCWRFILEVLRSFDNPVVRDEVPAGQENLGMKICMYIHQNYANDISIEKLARELNMSERHINRAYEQMFGITCMKNVNLLRIEYAKFYLCYTELSIERISEMVGFNSLNSFHKLFKKYEGITAGEYRLRCPFRRGNTKRE